MEVGSKDEYGRIQGAGLKIYKNLEGKSILNVGWFKDGKKLGEAISISEDGKFQEGLFKKNRLNEEITYFPNGNWHFGGYDNHYKELQGQGTLHFMFGDTYIGLFESDHKQGKGVYYYSDG